MKVLLVAVNDYVTLAVLQSLAVESIRADIISPQDMRFSRLSRYSNKYMFCQIDDLLKADASFAERIDHYCTTENIDIVLPVDMLPTACLARIRHHLETPVFPIPEFSVIRATVRVLLLVFIDHYLASCKVKRNVNLDKIRCFIQSRTVTYFKD